LTFFLSFFLSFFAMSRVCQAHEGLPPPGPNRSGVPYGAAPLTTWRALSLTTSILIRALLLTPTLNHWSNGHHADGPHRLRGRPWRESSAPSSRP
jgi:hypothetical protein